MVTATSNHNPVRAMPVDDLRPELVDVSYADLEKVLQRTENGLFPLAEAATASRTLAEVVPVLVEARPFASSVLHDAGNISSLRVLIQHALDRVGLSIDWKWLGHDGEAYQTAGDLADLFDLAVS